VAIVRPESREEVCSLGGEEICQEAQKLPEPPIKTSSPGMPLSRAQPARASPPSFKIRCHHLAYSVELVGTQNPLPKPCHKLTDQVN